MTDNKASLMASLTGGLPSIEPDEDLFGEIPIDDEPGAPSTLTTQAMLSSVAAPEGTVGQLIVDNPLDDDVQHPPLGANTNPLSMNMPVQPTHTSSHSTPMRSSLLASSGLLGDFGNGGGGLFDEVDKEEEERQRLEEQRRQEEERKRMEEERKRMEEQRRLEAEQQRQEEERRLREEQMMQTVNLSNSAVYPPHQYHQQPRPVQQLTHQVQDMSMSTPNPHSFAERSQLLQQQQQQMSMSQYAPQPGLHQQQMSPQLDPSGFYRPQPQQSPVQGMAKLPGQAATTYMYSSTGGEVQSHVITPTTAPSRLPVTPTPSATAGMHNAVMGRPSVRPMQIFQPPPVETIYGQVTVSNPLLVQPPSLFNVVPPHWTYQVQTSLKEGGCWLVQRRFRHIVALEDRLRVECVGSILPPRPGKHATRAIEEASTMQSVEFATQRCAEIQVYLNAIVHHPYAGRSSSLKIFLALQDDMGTAWPEVSSNALTRFGAVSGAAVQNVTETAMPWESNAHQDALEDNAELLALMSSEGIRMGAVCQAVPKLEGSITLLREHSEAAGAVGMELGKMCKAVEASDRDLYISMEILSQGLLRHGRREKRLALELSAAMNSFVTQYKLCKYEKMAFQDRRAALQKRVKERGRADFRAQKLMVHQRNFQNHAALGELDRLERDASLSDGMAVGAVHYCDIIGATLKNEVNRVAFERRTEWSRSMKVLSSSLKEAAAEQSSIWESTRDTFLQTFPEYSS